MLLLRALVRLRRVSSTLRKAAVSHPRPAASASRAAPMPRCSGTSGLREVGLDETKSARRAWSEVHWQDIMLRDGPDYRRNKIKRPTASPLLECVGVDIFRVERKIFTDGSEAHAAYLPAEVATAMRTPGQAGELPRYLVVSIAVPTYRGASTDGPGAKMLFYLAVPPELRGGRDGASAMAAEFLDGAAAGHATKGGKYYDRFKVIVRLRTLDARPGYFLKGMIDQFNGKPMLWRWFGVWGSLQRRHGVVFANLDMCTGGRLKNAAFASGYASASDGLVFDVSWTLEARGDGEMPERLLGGATVCRYGGSRGAADVPLLRQRADGSFQIVAPPGAK